MKFELYNNTDLEGIWDITIKIDGVRCHNTPQGKLSRKNKPLYNIPDFNGEIAEIYCGDFKTSIEKTRTFTKDVTISDEEVYILYPQIDDRLYLTTIENPTKEQILELFNLARDKGFEGLVLRQVDKFIKVKSKETYDVEILDIVEGTGRNKNRLGAFITTMGKVGSGLTDLDRDKYYNKKYIGETIEVDCMELTPSGKFRHPRFVRLREDK